MNAFAPLWLAELFEPLTMAATGGEKVHICMCASLAKATVAGTMRETDRKWDPRDEPPDDLCHECYWMHRHAIGQRLYEEAQNFLLLRRDQA